jgi:hypothetical protein
MAYATSNRLVSSILQSGKVDSSFAEKVLNEAYHDSHRLLETDSFPKLLDDFLNRVLPRYHAFILKSSSSFKGEELGER